jgi:hypothetical protein
MIAKPKYVTNKDLLREIHLSKATFCVFQDPRYADFDAIVPSLDDITPEVIERAIAKRMKALVKTNPDAVITQDDLVFRVMTFEHIPIDPNRKRKARNTDQSYARTNFPPFKHHVLREGQPIEVGRSHWRGTLEAGEFSVETGRVSNRLAQMWMLLVDRYSRRGNWRNYTYVDEMRAFALLQLSQVGLQFDESKSDNPFAFYTTTVRNCFTRILLVEKKSQHIRDDMLIMAGVAPSYTRQVEAEMEQKFPSEAVKKKPGRKAKSSEPR